MILRAVEARNFRNLVEVVVELHPRFNVLFGENGQGKTNFLEAVYLVGTLQSFRATRSEELLRFGTPEAHVRARLARDGLERIFAVTIGGQPPRKSATVDGKAVRATADHFGGFNVVLFSVDDLQLPRDAPANRRRFLDRAVWNAEPALLGEARSYARVLRSRNALLRDEHRPSQFGDLLDVYDAQLASFGASIVARRRRYLGLIAPALAQAFERITYSGLAANVGYQSTLPESDVEAALLAALRRARSHDLARGTTSVGPHADDLLFGLAERPAAQHASQGQLRAIVLAWKIAELELLASRLGEAPLLLLDDVSSELDEARNRYLFAFLNDLTCQVLITTTHPKYVQIDRDRCNFLVSNGDVRRC